MRIQFGGALVVQASEKWLTEIKAKRGFVMGGITPASVGNYSCLQLKNPAGSGKVALIRSLLVAQDPISQVGVIPYDTDLTTDIGAGVNLWLAGPAGVCHVRSEVNGGLVGVPPVRLLTPAYTITNLSPEWSFALDPGKGLAVCAWSVNVNVTATFLWNEY